jgi:hypothetical protein
MNINNNKVVPIVVGAVAALLVLSLVMRFVLLSTYGVSGSWMYVGLPIGGVGIVVLLLRLGLVNFGDRSGGAIHPWYPGGQVHTPPAPMVPSAPISQRLQELDGMYASGVISDAEYAAKRQQLITGMW